MDPPTLKWKTVCKSSPLKKIKRSYNVLTLKEKIELIDQSKKGVSQRSLAELHNIGKSTVSDIIKNETQIRDYVQDINCEKALSKRKTARKADNPLLDKALKAWFIQERNLGTPISGDLIKAKAIILK